MAIMFHLLISLLLTLFTFTLAENTHNVKCPCFTTISIPKKHVAHESYDLLVRHFSPNGAYINERLSRRNIILSDPNHAHTDFVFHRLKPISIPAAGKYSITLRPSQKSLTPAPDTMINLKTTARQVSCPVLFSQQTPTTTRFAIPHVDRSNSLLDYKIVNNSFVWTERQRGTDVEQERADQRIVGGAQVNRDLLPYIVAVLGPVTRRTLCTGVIIAPTWVVTAAHCQTRTTYTVVAGASQLFVENEDGVEIAIKAVHNNPRYGPAGRETFWDIALLELEQSVEEAAGINVFMKINFDGSIPASDSVVRVAGFGVTSFLSQIPDPFPQRLRQVDLPVVENRRCRLNYKRATSLLVGARWQFCAGYLVGGCDSCQGDSGGPVFQYDSDNLPVLMGTVSSGAGCASPNFPSINARMSAFRSFFLSTGAEFTENTATVPQVSPGCERGFFLFSSGFQLARCEPCPAEGFSLGGLARTCEPCPSGTTQDPNDGGRCI